MERLETDPETGVELYRLVDDPRPADDIYCEQPYASRDGGRIAVRFSAADGQSGELAILDLSEGSLETVLDGTPRFPAFHAWGEYLYFQEEVDGRVVLNRCEYATAETERVTVLPDIPGEYKYGTVSQDHRYYAVVVNEADLSRVVLFDVARDEHSVLTERADYEFKHEQFSSDGTNRLLVQANSQPDIEHVHLGVFRAGDDDGVQWLAADRPHTPRPTGHEAWVGQTDQVLFSTVAADDHDAKLWVVGVDDDEPRRVTEQWPYFGPHVSVSRDGRYWLADARREPGVPICVGSVETGEYRRVVETRTADDDRQASHTHPYLTANNQWVIFNSTRCGHPQVFGARLPDGFLERLLP